MKKYFVGLIMCTRYVAGRVTSGQIAYAQSPNGSASSYRTVMIGAV